MVSFRLGGTKGVSPRQLIYIGMTKQFIESVLLALAKERKVFWSEADFQFAFAWKLKEMFEDSNPQSTINVRLERRVDAL